MFLDAAAVDKAINVDGVCNQQYIYVYICASRRVCACSLIIIGTVQLRKDRSWEVEGVGDVQPMP